MSSFNLDEDALKAFMGDAMARLISAYQQMLDGLVERYRGHPVEEIKPALAAAWAEVNDGHVSEPELSRWAQAIADGVHIEIRPGDLG